MIQLILEPADMQPAYNKLPYAAFVDHYTTHRKKALIPLIGILVAVILISGGTINFLLFRTISETDISTPNILETKKDEEIKNIKKQEEVIPTSESNVTATVEPIDTSYQTSEPAPQPITQSILRSVPQVPSLPAPQSNPAPEPQSNYSYKDDYIFPSDREYITFEFLSTLSKDQIALIRNEIYARHGYIFQTDKYINYFSQKSWYVPNPNFSESLFNEIEKANKDTIVSYETEMGWR